MASQEPMLRSVQVLKQEADDLGLESQTFAQYVKQQLTLCLDREKRAAWRDVWKRQPEADAQKIQADI